VHKSLFIVAILALVFGVAPADAVDDFVRAEMKRQRVPGLALAVVRDGRITTCSTTRRALRRSAKTLRAWCA